MCGLGKKRIEPFEGYGQMGAALAVGKGMHFVDDHGVDVTQCVASPRCQKQKQRLRCRDPHVGGILRLPGSFRLGRVTGSDANGNRRNRHARASGDLLETDQGAAQIALNVGGEGFQWGDVQHSLAVRRWGVCE